LQLEQGADPPKPGFWSSQAGWWWLEHWWNVWGNDG
jgi:hypothetical protein